MRARKVARLAVVLERLPVGVDGARGVARLQQVLDRLLRLVGLGEVAGEEPVGLLGRFLVDVLQRLADALVQLPALRVDEARRRRPPGRGRAGSGTRGSGAGASRRSGRDAGARSAPASARRAERAARGAAGRRCARSPPRCERTSRVGAVEAVEARLQRPLHGGRDRRARRRPTASCQPPFRRSRAPRSIRSRMASSRKKGFPPERSARSSATDSGSSPSAACETRTRERVGGQRAHLDLPVAVRVALARALAQPPGAVLALGPVEEEERDRGLVGDAEDRSRAARASPRRPSAGPRRRGRAAPPRRACRRARRRPRTSATGCSRG